MIVSLDPGATTGVCTFHHGMYKTYHLKLFEYPHPHSILYDHLSELKSVTIIYEPFHHRAGQLGVVLKGVEYIGVIELWAQHQGAIISTVTPGTGKGGFWRGNSKIRALGLWNTKANPHGMDALRIMLSFQMDKYPEIKKILVDKLRSTLRVV